MYPHKNLVSKNKDVWTIPQTELYVKRELKLYWGKLALADDATRHQRQYLTRSLKQFMSAYMDLLGARYGGISGATVLGVWGRINVVVSWMTERQIWRLSQLTRDDMIEFLRSPGQRTNTARSAGTIKSYVALFNTLWQLREKYTAPLRINPWGLGKERSVRGAATRSDPWKPAPDALALPLIDDALAWLDQYGEFTVELASRIWKLRNRQLGKSHGVRRRAAEKEYHSISQLPTFQQMVFALKAEHNRTGSVVRKAITTTQDAVLVTILFLVGPRISEVFSLKADCLAAQQLNNGTDAYFIQGVAAKKHAIVRQWIVPESVRRGIELLIRLHDQQRICVGFKYLFIAGNGIVDGVGRKTRRVPANSGPRMIKRFAGGAFRAKKWPATHRLHPHAARKTFASMVMRRDKHALGALANHLGHLRDMITAGSYGGGDLELSQIMQEEDRKDLVDGLTDLLMSSEVAGPAAPALAAARASVGDPKTFRGKRVLEAMVEDMISKGVVLAPCYWGYCVYSRMHSACRGDDFGPNPIERCADVCARCRNFCVTQKHRPFWEQRHARDELFLKSPNLSEQTILVVQRRLARSASVLASLNNQAVTESADKERRA